MHEALGAGAVRAVVLRREDQGKRFECDLLVVSLGLWPRDGLARMALPGEAVALVGDAALDVADDPCGDEGTVCLCEDVSMHDLEQAWDEGFRNAEIVKRYTTTTMGPCQGAMCGRALSCFAASKGDPAGSGAVAPAVPRTTARPPARPVTLETLAAGVHEIVDKRTSLHEVHLAAGARLDRSGGWLRPFTYGDWREEYRAVRERVSLMDVGTLGKFTIAGPGASDLVDRMFPARTGDLAPGRTRYVLSLDDAGYVMDDGLLARVGEREWYLTSTSGGATRTDARLRHLVDRLGLDVHVLDRTAQWGAINVAGPHARDLLARLTEDPIGATDLPYPGFADITVAGVACRAIRTGFVGELAFELHHPRRRGPELWRALESEGRAWDQRPHGLDALELLRLEKGHIYLGQDTMPDDTPTKLGMSWAVDPSKPWFIGKRALERLADLPVGRRLVGLEFTGGPHDTASLRGEPLLVGEVVVGRVTSAERSPALGRAIGLGWVRTHDGALPDRLETAPGAAAEVVSTPFYDPRWRSGPWLSCGESCRRSWPCSPPPRCATGWCRRQAPSRCGSPLARCCCVGPVDVGALTAAIGEDGLVADVSDAWVGLVLEGADAPDAFARVSELELPERGWIQGEVARAASKVLVEPGRIEVLVPAMLAEHVEARIRADAAEVLAP